MKSSHTSSSMDYRETLFFVAKCLTLNSEKLNLEIVRNEIASENIDWDAVVKLSTNHFVFSALYCNLKKSNLIHFLPKDLIGFMQDVTKLNRDRNLEILEQVRELNELLLQNNITPVFLKGVGYLLQDAYSDIAERMIADIDFIVSKKEYAKAISVIKKSGYSKVHQNKHHSPSFKHYPRLQKKDCIAAVEIHKELLIEKFSDEFNYDIIHDNILNINGFKVLSYADQLTLSILGNQINDDGFYFKNLTLKSAYDVYLMSKKTNAKNALQKFDKLKYPLNSFLASCYQAFNNIDSLTYESSKNIDKYLKYFNLYLVDHKKRKKDFKKIEMKLSLIRKKDLMMKMIFDKEYRIWFLQNLKNK